MSQPIDIWLGDKELRGAVMVVAVVAPLMGRDQKIDTSLPPFISPLVANTQISCPSTHFLFGCYPLLVAIIIIIFIFNLTYCFGG